jgi:hypothetical protein
MLTQYTSQSNNVDTVHQSDNTLLLRHFLHKKYRHEYVVGKLTATVLSAGEVSYCHTPHFAS